MNGLESDFIKTKGVEKMAREKQITRRFLNYNVKAKIYDESVSGVIEAEFSFNSKPKSPEKEISKRLKEGQALIKITDVVEIEKLYGMTAETFLKNAVEIEKRSDNIKAIENKGE